MTGANDSADIDGGAKPKPTGAWTAEETVKYMFEKVRLGHFYIVVPVSTHVTLGREKPYEA